MRKIDRKVVTEKKEIGNSKQYSEKALLEKVSRELELYTEEERKKLHLVIDSQTLKDSAQDYYKVSYSIERKENDEEYNKRIKSETWLKKISRFLRI